MERKNWARRKKLEKELKELDVEEFPPIAIAKAPPVSGCERGAEEEMERLRDENAVLFASLQDLSEANRRAELELRVVRNKLQASEKEKSRLQYELHLLKKQLQIRSGQEKELSSASGEVEDQECDELLRGLTAKKSFSSNMRVWSAKGVGSPSHHEDDNYDDDISCAESWASALLSELDHFKPKQSQDLAVVSEIIEVIQPVAVHLRVETGGLLQAKEKVASLQDHALLHFLQHLSSLLASILSPGNAFYSDPARETNLQLEIDQLHRQIEDLNKELQSQINQRQRLAALNEKLDKDLEAYRREKDACEMDRNHKEEEGGREDSEKKLRRIEDLAGEQVGVAGYVEKEKCVWAEEEEDVEKEKVKEKEKDEEEKITLRRVPLFRRLFLCASPRSSK